MTSLLRGAIRALGNEGALRNVAAVMDEQRRQRARVEALVARVAALRSRIAA